jgi:hypothetical protein
VLSILLLFRFNLEQYRDPCIVQIETYAIVEFVPQSIYLRMNQTEVFSWPTFVSIQKAPDMQILTVFSTG